MVEDIREEKVTKISSKEEKKETKEEEAGAVATVDKAVIEDIEGEGPPVFVTGLADMTVKDGDKVMLEVEITGM